MFVSPGAALRRFAVERWLILLLLLAVPVVEWLAQHRGGPGPSLALVRNPFTAIAAASVFCRYLIHDRRGRARKWMVYATPVPWLAAWAIEGRNAPPAFMWLDALAGLGALGVLGFVLGALVATDAGAKSGYTDGLMDAMALPLGASMVSYGLWATSTLNPVYDSRVYAFEEILGFRFSLIGVRSYRALSALSAVATGCYALVALAITLVASAQRDRRREQAVLTATLVAGAVGFAFYFVCPVVGPLTAFGPLYPADLPSVAAGAPLVQVSAVAPRNGMPSLHTIWALLIWFNAQSLRRGVKRALRVFVLLTLWAVMGLTDTHWFMDVVVGVPLAVAIQAALVSRAAETAGRTWSTVVGCLTLTLAWLWGLRSGVPLLNLPPVLAWAAVVVTIGWPLLRGRTPARVSLPGIDRNRGDDSRWVIRPFESSS